MRRSRLGWAGLISVLLHVALLAWLWGREPVRPVSAPPPAPTPLVVEIVSTPAPLPAPIPTSAPTAPARPPPPRPAPRPAPKPPAADQQAPAPAPPEAATEPSEPSELSARPDAPLAQASKPPVLVPPSATGGWSLPATALPPMQSGHTLHPDDPSLSPEALKAEEHARVTERVQGFAEDDLATLRVENGLVHPYFSGIRNALAKQMEKAPLFETQGLGQRLAQNYLKQAQDYGSGGTHRPSGLLRGPNDRAAPTPSERLESISRGNPAHDSMRAFLQAGEAVQELAEPPAELRIILELQQAADGQLRSVTVVETSGNKAFDTFVLDSVPASLAKLPPPPAEALGRHKEGLHTLWSVEGRVVYIRHIKELKGQDAWYIASAAGLGLLAGKFEETTGDIYVIDLRNPKFVCRPRLLKVW